MVPNDTHDEVLALLECDTMAGVDVARMTSLFVLS